VLLGTNPDSDGLHVSGISSERCDRELKRVLLQKVKKSNRLTASRFHDSDRNDSIAYLVDVKSTI